MKNQLYMMCFTTCLIASESVNGMSSNGFQSPVIKPIQISLPKEFQNLMISTITKSAAKIANPEIANQTTQGYPISAEGTLRFKSTTTTPKTYPSDTSTSDTEVIPTTPPEAATDDQVVHSKAE